MKHAVLQLIISVLFLLVTLVTLSRVVLQHLALDKHAPTIIAVYQHVQPFLVLHWVAQLRPLHLHNVPPLDVSLMTVVVAIVQKMSALLLDTQ
jgi:hypothetical protein